MAHAILLISCPDQKGLTAAVTNFVYKNGGNIIHADQHIDEQTNTFFMRIEWDLKGFKIGKDDIGKAFEGIARPFRMQWQLNFSDALPKVAIFVSKQLHCLQDLLYRHQAGQLPCAISLIISNHKLAESIARNHDIPSHYFPITDGTKVEQERKELALLNKNGIELLVLARYHQILTKKFVSQYTNRIINIHHSFLPAFAGKNPYAQAYQKGVKIIGATSHYVTEELDAGPIIEQDTARVSHRDSLADMVRKGEDLERVVLSRAVRWHLERKILTYNNKTVVFG